MSSPYLGMATFSRNQAPYITELLADLGYVARKPVKSGQPPAGRQADFPQTRVMLSHVRFKGTVGRKRGKRRH